MEHSALEVRDQPRGGEAEDVDDMLKTVELLKELQVKDALSYQAMCTLVEKTENGTKHILRANATLRERLTGQQQETQRQLRGLRQGADKLQPGHRHARARGGAEAASQGDRGPQEPGPLMNLKS